MSLRHGPAPPSSASTASIRMISDTTRAMPRARPAPALRSAAIHARHTPAMRPSLTQTIAPKGATKFEPNAAQAAVPAYAAAQPPATIASSFTSSRLPGGSP